MTARVLVLGDPAYTDMLAVEKVLQSAYLAVRPLSETPPELATMGCEGPERWAESLFTQHGLRVATPRYFPSSTPKREPYVRMNSLVSAYPDVVLIFGTNKLLVAAAERCARHQIEPIIVEG